MWEEIKMSKRRILNLGLAGAIILNSAGSAQELKILGNQFTVTTPEALDSITEGFITLLNQQYPKLNNEDLTYKIDMTLGAAFSSIQRQSIDPLDVTWTFFEGMNGDHFRFGIRAEDGEGRSVYEADKTVNLETVATDTTPAPVSVPAAQTIPNTTPDTTSVAPVTPKIYGRGLGLTAYTGDVLNGDLKTDVPRVAISYPISERVRVRMVFSPNTDVASTTNYSVPRVVNEEPNIGGGPLSGITYENTRRTRATSREVLFGLEREIASSALSLLLGAEVVEGTTYREVIEELKEGTRLRERKPKVVPNTDYQRTKLTQGVGVNFPVCLGDGIRANLDVNHKGTNFRDNYRVFAGITAYLRRHNSEPR